MKVLDINGLTQYNESLLNKVETMIDEKSTEHTHDYIPMSGSTEVKGTHCKRREPDDHWHCYNVQSTYL